MADYTKVNGVAAADIVKIDGAAIADIEKVDGATKPSGVAYDWDESGFVFTDVNLTDGNSGWNSGGHGNYTRKVTANNGDYTNKVVPYFDDSSGTKKLTFVDCGHCWTRDDRYHLEEGTWHGGATDTPQSVKCDTGVEFDGNNMVDGDHHVKWKYRHDVKSDIYYVHTAVMSVSSNVISVYCIRKTGAGTAYESVGDTKDAANLEYQLTWDNSDNTWTITDETEKRFDPQPGGANHNPGANDDHVAFYTTGGQVGQDHTPGSVTADATDKRVWSIAIEEI